MAQTQLSLGKLERVIHLADPTAMLVPQRILRRVIKHDRKIPGLGLRVPHRKSFTIAAAPLLDLVERSELGISRDYVLPPRVILLARPTNEQFAEQTAEEILLKYWQLLFHARVHVALEKQAATQLPPYEVRRRIHAIGRQEFEEIRATLRHDDYLLPPADDLGVYIEFAAVFLELRHFAGGMLRFHFPAIRDFERIDEILKQDLNAEALLRATRLEGCPMPSPLRTALPSSSSSASLQVNEEFDRIDHLLRQESEADSGAVDSMAELPGQPDAETELPLPQPLAPATESASKRERRGRAIQKLLARADRVRAVGNSVRAAVIRKRAAELADPDQSAAILASAGEDLDVLAERLKDALEYSDEECQKWCRILPELLHFSSQGLWPVETRLLYDLQKVCVDHERGVYKLDGLGWLKSLGKSPLRRPLPSQREVLIATHLRSAAKRLPAIRVSGQTRSELGSLLTQSVKAVESRLRDRLRPRITDVLQESGLRPANLPERIARSKMVEELLDRILERGFINLGVLRDAISRNNLKLPDLSGPWEFFAGDTLLRADRHLARRLDGVYYRGEVYLRWPQRLSSLAFGTPVGRFLTRHVILPFGGAYLVLSFFLHLILAALRSDAGVDIPTWALVTVGLILWGVLHWPAFRLLIFNVGRLSYRAGRKVVVEIPLWVVNLPLVQRIRQSRVLAFIIRYVVKPAVFFGLIWWVLRLIAPGFHPNRWTNAGIFVVINLLLNSRVGREIDEVITDLILRSWDHFRLRILTTLYHFVVELFQRLMVDLERLLYTVDEWLRFRRGETRLSFTLKVVLGSVWNVFHYLVRIYVTLLIEPQVNPIKHFPVVTVSHKVILPLSPTLTQILAAPLMPLGTVLATSIAATNVLLLPGVFGFLVWELKENWRLYAANRAPGLFASGLGPHGETLARLFKPGFYTGSVPKRFAKLRRAGRKAYWSGNWHDARKHWAVLATVEEALRRFMDRELIALLNESRGLEGLRFSVGEIHLATNLVRIELTAQGRGCLGLVFGEEAGWITARATDLGQLGRLSDRQRETLRAALAGLYKLAGIDVVHEQLQPALGVRPAQYDLHEHSIVVWQDPLYRESIRFLIPRTSGDDGEMPFGEYPPWPNRDGNSAIFSRCPIVWDDWLATWERDQSSSRLPVRRIQVPLLPDAEPNAAVGPGSVPT
jgi:hypothetical protein